MHHFRVLLELHWDKSSCQGYNVFVPFKSEWEEINEHLVFQQIKDDVNFVLHLFSFPLSLRELLSNWKNLPPGNENVTLMNNHEFIHGIFNVDAIPLTTSITLPFSSFPFSNYFLFHLLSSSLKEGITEFQGFIKAHSSVQRIRQVRLVYFTWNIESTKFCSLYVIFWKW